MRGHENAEAGALVALDAEGRPHWIALDSTGMQIVISGGGTLDQATGALALDERFRDVGFDAPGVTFERAAWVEAVQVSVREEGHVLTGDAHVVPADEADLVERLKRARREVEPPALPATRAPSATETSYQGSIRPRRHILMTSRL